MTGWDQRLLTYFWPTPDTGYAQERDQFEEFQRTAAPLAAAIEQRGRWDNDQCRAAVQFAESVFDWGQVPPRGPITARDVFRVMVNALCARVQYPDAPMGTGWSKVACFTTAHFDGVRGRSAQVIWDSRVSNSLTRRLDRLLHAAGVKAIPKVLEHVVIVPGRGGTRAHPEPLRLDWRRGVITWDCQFAGTRIVARMRDILNAGTRVGPGDPYPRMPLPDGRVQLWTVRGTEMVLFMDGY